MSSLKQRRLEILEFSLKCISCVIPLVGAVFCAVKFTSAENSPEIIFLLYIAAPLFAFMLTQQLYFLTRDKREEKERDEAEKLLKLKFFGEEIPHRDIYVKWRECVEQCRRARPEDQEYAISLTSYRELHPISTPNGPESYYHKTLELFMRETKCGVRRLITINTIEKLQWVKDMWRDLKDCNFTYIITLAFFRTRNLLSRQ